MNTVNTINEMAQKIRLNNLDQLYKDIRNNNKELDLKIENYIKRYNLSSKYTVSDIKNKILEYDFFAYLFTKDPYKQNFVEKYVASEVKKIKGITHFLDHPAGVKLYLSGGKITNKRSNKTTKSIEYRLYF